MFFIVITFFSYWKFDRFLSSCTTGKAVGVTCVVIVGGMDMTQQALELGKRPHIIVATPGRLVDHLEKTKGFNLKALKYLVS